MDSGKTLDRFQIFVQENPTMMAVPSHSRCKYTRVWMH